jgi:hypothetical protein
MHAHEFVMWGNQLDMWVALATEAQLIYMTPWPQIPAMCLSFHSHVYHVILSIGYVELCVVMCSYTLLDDVMVYAKKAI